MSLTKQQHWNLFAIAHVSPSMREFEERDIDTGIVFQLAKMRLVRLRGGLIDGRWYITQKGAQTLRENDGK